MKTIITFGLGALAGGCALLYLYVSGDQVRKNERTK